MRLSWKKISEMQMPQQHCRIGISTDKKYSPTDVMLQKFLMTMNKKPKHNSTENSSTLWVEHRVCAAMFAMLIIHAGS